MDLRVFSALEDVRVRKNPLALDFEKISGLRAFDLEYSRDERRNLSSSTVCHESLIRLHFHTLRSVKSLTPLILCTFDIIGKLVAKQRCQQWPGLARTNRLWVSPPVICLSLPMLLSKDIQLYPLRLESQILLVPARLFAFALSHSRSNFFVIFLVLYSSLKHCPTMNINKAENINSPSVLSSSQA